MQLADVTAMPKNFGKTIKRFHYMPLLDDRNINDQGIDAAGVTIANGNLYGSSKDIGTITGKLPVLSEAGGRVNRVGFKRIELQGSIEKFGFFDEYTQESVDFDSDAELMQHISREMINGAHEITEDALMIDVINSAGVLRYAGAATTKATVSDTDVVTYADLVRLNVDLDNNRCPKHTTISTGTRMIDTKVIPSARVLYTATEMLPTLKAMTDLHCNQAFIGVEKYAAGTTTLNGEVGMIDQFRIVIHPEMVRWAGAGAATTNGTVYSTNGKVDVFPMVVVGDQSFTTIGFQTDGQTVKFKITHKKPGEETASQLDPYGETGFMSIKWYYGFMALRPERIAVIHTAAKM
jgi:N4-gp56 family major capsid protein